MIFSRVCTERREIEERKGRGNVLLVVLVNAEEKEEKKDERDKV